MQEREAWARLSALLREAAEVLDRLAQEKSADERGGQEAGASCEHMMAVEEVVPNARERQAKALAVLEGLGIEVRKVLEISEEEQALLMLSRLIAERYPLVRPFLQRVKRHQGDGSPFQMSLANAAQEEVGAITQLATLAHQAGLLAEYTYWRSPRRLLRAAPSRHGLAINFFTGSWLELYIMQVVEQILREAGDADAGCVFRAQVVFPNGDQFDLDAFLVVHGRRIWIEAKTGDDFADKLPKYARLRPRLCQQREEALLVCADMQSGDPMAAMRGRLAEMQLCGLDDFEVRLRELACAS